MRWLFLLLLVLNVFYYVWHQQEAPLKAKDVAPLSLYKGSQQEIRLLRETGVSAPARRRDECLVVGGLAAKEQLDALRQRLLSLDINALPVSGQLPGADGLWLKISPESERLLDQTVLVALSNDFKDLKHKIIFCQGIATGE
ncbi:MULTISPECIES: hypothetical protein [unclassified Pseudomonas]|jgi:hypothetical protein|uniref:hypothetical protein n=1 Tax=unclassified Pseudomonas TaxID=196821 RepID=UPI000408EF21|nr:MULTISPECIES: hypothetical protein [unclassified Pseudomonas]GLO59477.1 hypothetical protein PPUJ20066_55130 [Pseudomonas putida]MCX2689337.1 hypothetical protein [Pseudomonas sp. DCB_AW]MDE4538163.1 hypothetical protein [Pseudomonas sp. ITEM 17296]SMF68820.1 hypothetical protein SAMN02745962_05540 [Pseudomonas sp. LAIL14HWK12:I11]SMR82048.1 hypothetical protein SAMN05661028_05535 [Pseudomonas sp. LAIL14HWK12:I10]